MIGSRSSKKHKIYLDGWKNWTCSLAARHKSILSSKSFILTDNKQVDENRSKICETSWGEGSVRENEHGIAWRTQQHLLKMWKYVLGINENVWKTNEPTLLLSNIQNNLDFFCFCKMNKQNKEWLYIQSSGFQFSYYVFENFFYCSFQLILILLSKLTKAFSISWLKIIVKGFWVQISNTFKFQPRTF
jgi:hypothetical protein